MSISSPLLLSAADALDELVACVCDELETHGAGPVCWCGMLAGEDVSWEFCTSCSGDECGMGWVRLMGVFPYSTFPAPAADINCVLPLAWQVELGALRCLPVPSEQEAPTPNQMAEVVMAQIADATALYRALRCCPANKTMAEMWTPLGPQGGCVGGTWAAYLAID